MARPRFSDFLSNRRRQLGLTIPQAARVLRLKEQVLVAFEEGDWDRIPRSGYAQGMLSSYARYLGLNPREVIDLFQDDFNAYAGGPSPSRRSSSESRGQRDRHAGPGQTTPASRDRDRDLYGSAGPAGSILSGTLLGTSYLHGRDERGGSSPLVNGRSAGYSERYLRQNGYATPGAEGGAALPPASLSGDPEPSYPQGRPYTGRAPRPGQARARRNRQASSAPGRAAGRNRSTRAREDARRYASSDIQTRDVAQGMYDDDLRYGLASDSYRQASSAEVRETARTQAASPQRPNVRRRPSAAARSRSRDVNRTPPPRSGVLGVVDAWFSDPRRTMLTIFVAVAVVLILVIVLSVRSCTSPAPEGGNRDQIPVTQTPAADSSDQGTDDANQGTDDAAATDGQTPQTTPAEPAEDPNQPVEVVVEVPDGSAVWVEVRNGDKNEVAQTVTGPWTQTFTVDGELEVRTADPTQVTVTANGKPVSFDTSAAGIGTATVKGPEKTDAAQGQGTDAAGTDGSAATSSADGGQTGSPDSGRGSADADANEG